MKTQPLFVLGAGGHAKVIISMLEDIGQPVSCVLDDNEAVWGESVMGVPVVGPISELSSYKDASAVIAIGSNQVRKIIADTFPDMHWVTVIHPSAIVHPSASIGSGTVICAGAVVQPDAVIGNHTVVNTLASVDHDCAIGSYVHVAPGVHLSGAVRLGDGALMGVGSSAIPLAEVGEWSIVGAGAAVVKPIPARSTAVGLSAKPIRSHALRVPKARLHAHASGD